MRTLYEIVEGAKDGHRPTADESYYAMLVLAALLNMTMADVAKLAAGRTTYRDVIAAETHRRAHVAFDADPQAFLGDDVPGNPGYDAFRALGKRLVDRVLGQEEPTS